MAHNRLGSGRNESMGRDEEDGVQQQAESCCKASRDFVE